MASKLDSSALAPAIAPLATAAALATTDGQVAAHGSGIAALQSLLTTGLSNKADQSAFDVLEGVVATKSTPPMPGRNVMLENTTRNWKQAPTMFWLLPAWSSAADCAARRHTTREINESASVSQLRAR